MDTMLLRGMQYGRFHCNHLADGQALLNLWTDDFVKRMQFVWIITF
jgi:hypothetical protein